MWMVKEEVVLTDYNHNTNVVMWMVNQEVVSIDFYNKPNIVMLMVKEEVVLVDCSYNTNLLMWMVNQEVVSIDFYHNARQLNYKTVTNQEDRESELKHQFLEYHRGIVQNILQLN